MIDWFHCWCKGL